PRGGVPHRRGVVVRAAGLPQHRRRDRRGRLPRGHAAQAQAARLWARRDVGRPLGPVLMSEESHGRTARLELADQTLREWDATVLDSSPAGVVLDRSAFYPCGGGQPPDHGVLLWGGVQTRIGGVRKGDDLVLVPVEGGPVPPAGTAARRAVED